MIYELKPWRKLAYTGLLATSVSAFALAASVNAQESEDEDTIVVTGSRIERSGLDTVRPSLEVGADTFDKRAFTNIGDALAEVPTFGQGIDLNGAQNGFSVGQNFIDLFDLGTARTLTLVNGRRFVSSSVPTTFNNAQGLQVDLNAIPIALVESIDVVPLAGAAVYGSDSIAGTINIILRDDYEGFEVSGQYGLAQEGDFEQYQVQSVLGGNFADGRGNAVFSVEYNRQDGGLLRRRDNFFLNDPNLVSFGNTLDVDNDGDADQEFRIYRNQVVQLFGEFGSVSPTATNIPSFGIGALPDGNLYQFDQNGDLQTCEAGVTPGASSAFFAQGGNCGIDFFDSVAQIRSPIERINISTFGTFDVTENITAFLESTFSNSNASELVNQGGFQTFAFGGSSAALAGLSVDNPFLSDQARGILVGNGLDTFAVNRFNNDLVNAGENSAENSTWRVAAGFDGEFEIGRRGFSWSVSGVFGNADIETREFGIVDGRFFNAIDATILDATSLQPIIDEGLATTVDEALGVFNADGLSGVSSAMLGDVVCQANIDVAAGTAEGFNQTPQGGGISSGSFPFADGCIPINLFGDASQLNSEAAIQFINGNGPRITSANNEQRVFTAFITGDVFELPAGWVKLNAGFETRRDRAVFTPGLGTALDITRSSSFPETGGQSRTIEFFGETFLPIFNSSNAIPGFELFQMEASVRRVNNETEGLGFSGSGETNSTAWEFGGRWKPIEDLTFRGSYTTAIRTPSLVELFSPEVQAFLFANDPCDARFVTDGLVPELRRANCIAAGIDPDTFTSNVVNASIIGASAGNPALTPERSRSYTVGTVIEPRWIDNMSLQMDYFRIAIEDRISNLSLTQILGACFDSPSFPDTPACSNDLFVRDDEGQVIFGRTTSLNAAQSVYKGVQSRWQYLVDVADGVGLLPDSLGMGGFADRDLGELQFDVTVLRAIQNELQVLDEEPNDPIGEFQDPKWQGTFDVTYRVNNLRLFWRAAWQDKPVFDSQFNSFISNVGPGDEGAASTAENVIDDRQRDRIIHNMSLQYTFFDTTSVQFAINNVLNRQPGVVDFAAGNFGAVEQLGRTFNFRVRHQF